MSKPFAWERSHVESLLDWMEDNQVALRGSKSAWVKDCKEQVFQDSPDVTIERIGVKHNNLKASWTAGRKKLDGTGYGSREG